MSEEPTYPDPISDEGKAAIENAFETLENILYPQMAIIRAAVNGELPGKDIRLPSTIKEVSQALNQLKEFRAALMKIADQMNDRRSVLLNRLHQYAMAYYRAVEEAARQNVPGAQKIRDDLKQFLPDE